jgi:hypothetical protein
MRRSDNCLIYSQFVGLVNFINKMLCSEEATNPLRIKMNKLRINGGSKLNIFKSMDRVVKDLT